MRGGYGVARDQIAGQVCNCAERIYVQRKIADEFTEKLTIAMEATRWREILWWTIRRGLRAADAIRAGLQPRWNRWCAARVAAGADAGHGRPAVRHVEGGY